MFEVTIFDPPYIYVRCRRTAETYEFRVGDDGALTHSKARYDHCDARRAAIAFLAQRTQPVRVLEALAG